MESNSTKNAQGWHTLERPFQFSLLHLFLLTTAASILLTTGQLLGNFLTSLLLGLLVIGVVISLLHIDNPILAGLTGVALALILLLGTFLLCSSPDEAGGGWKVVVSLLLYPQFGYTLGIICTANSIMDSD